MFYHMILNIVGFPGNSVAKNLPASVGEAGGKSSIAGSGRSLGERNGSLLQYSCLENSIDRGAWMGSQRVGHNLVTGQQYQHKYN